MSTTNGSAPSDGKPAPSAAVMKSDPTSESANAKEASLPNGTSAAAAAMEEDTEGFPKCKTFDSVDFMNFLATNVDIAHLMVETKDGERFSAAFSGPSTVTGGVVPPPAFSDGPPPSVFRSLDLLKSLESTGDDAPADATVFQSKVNLEYFPPRPGKQAAVAAANGASSSLGSDPFVSKEWAADYKNSHVEVPYKTAFESGENGASLPPKKRGTNWDAMFKQALAPLVDAASVAQREHSQVVPGLDGLKDGATMDTSPRKRVGRRKPRKIIPETKEYVEFTEKDVLFGRGGRSNHHPGNKVYREVVTQHQEHYRSCDKNEKTKVAQSIVDHVQQTVGGRFLELDKEVNRWYLVPNVVARRKVGQALRENNTEEARAAKRAKYQGKIGAASKKAAEVAAAAAQNLKLQQATSVSAHV